MKTSTAIVIIIIIGVLGYGGYVFFVRDVNTEPITSNELSPMTDVTELKIEVVAEGTGEGARAGNSVDVHYTGMLTDGTVFDSSIPRGRPFTFVLGQGSVIRGWDIGVDGMKVGEKRRLTIPSDLAYGEQGAAGGLIPPNATLIFDVELLAIH